MPDWCPKCRAMLPEGQEKCPVCGAKMPSEGSLGCSDVFILSLYIFGVTVVPLLIVFGIGFLCVIFFI
jgi:hypothetical protein